MANPLKMLKLKPTAIQFIVETPINASPEKAWSAITNPGQWFLFSPEEAAQSKHTFILRPGSHWTVERADGTCMLVGTLVYFEPGKLLRIAGPIGLTHVPTNGVLILELQPKGKETLLRAGIRLFGFLDKDVKKRYQSGWKQLSSQIKALAEG